MAEQGTAWFFQMAMGCFNEFLVRMNPKELGAGIGLQVNPIDITALKTLVCLVNYQVLLQVGLSPDRRAAL